jgi:hypothetical protein
MNIKEEILSRMVSYLSEDWIEYGIVEVYNKSQHILGGYVECDVISHSVMDLDTDSIRIYLDKSELCFIDIEDLKMYKKKLKRNEILDKLLKDE